MNVQLYYEVKKAHVHSHHPHPHHLFKIILHIGRLFSQTGISDNRSCADRTECIGLHRRRPEFLQPYGLEITFKDYDSGATAAAGMLNSEVDIALAAKFPIVRQVFNQRDIVIFGTITKYENTFITCRTDSGIIIEP
jgi:hypothetical protein